MSGFRLSVLLAALSLSGCMMSDPPSRGQSPQSLLIETSQASGYAVKAVNVVVPRSLVVSEANSYKPTADIVWHGDADGDRYGQVKTIVQGAMSRATQGMTQGRAVVLDVVVTKFHALTQKTRDSIGGKNMAGEIAGVKGDDTIRRSRDRHRQHVQIIGVRQDQTRLNMRGRTQHGLRKLCSQ